MLAAALAGLGTLLYGTLIGYWTHWALHQSWAGHVYRAHLNHHLRQYPPRSLISDVYRDAGKDNSLFTFIPVITLAGVPWVVLLWGLGLPWWGTVAVLIEGILVGWLHDHVHDGFHLTSFWLTRFPWFLELRKLHWAHHWNIRKNLGVVWFGWDRIFGTLRVPKDP